MGRGLGRLHQHLLERADRPRGPGERSRWPGHPQWWRDRGRAASTSGGRGFSALEYCEMLRAPTRSCHSSIRGCVLHHPSSSSRARTGRCGARTRRSGEAPLRHGPCRHRRVLPARLPPLQGGTQAGLRRAPSGDALRRCKTRTPRARLSARSDRPPEPRDREVCCSLATRNRRGGLGAVPGSERQP